MKLIVLDRLVALKEVPAHEKVLQVMIGRLTVRKLSFSIDKHYVKFIGLHRKLNSVCL